MGYSPLDRKILAIRKSLHYRRIAEACEVDPRLVSLVMQGRRRCGTKAQRVMAHIAKITNIPVTRLFPEMGVDRRYKQYRSAV